jgi:hypothetical protein
MNERISDGVITYIIKRHEMKELPNFPGYGIRQVSTVVTLEARLDRKRKEHEIASTCPFVYFSSGSRDFIRSI